MFCNNTVGVSMAQTRRDVTLHEAVRALMRTFGMKQDDEGVCIGFTYAALLAALAPSQIKHPTHFSVGDFETFRERLRFIMRIYEEKDIPEKIDAIRKKIISKQAITAEEKMYLDIPAFLQRIDMHFQPQAYAKQYPSLFQHRKEPYSQQSEKIFFASQPESVVPTSLDANKYQQVGVIRAHAFTGVYNATQLESYSALLKENLEALMASHQDQAVVMTLKVVDHAIMLAYQNGQWIIFNPNYKMSDLENKNGDVPFCMISNAKDMATKIGNAFSRDGVALPLNSFSTELYVLDEKIAQELTQRMTVLNNQSDWSSIHNVNLQNATAVVPHQSDRLTIAAKIGDTLMLKDLMKDQRFRPSTNILFIALQRGHEEFVLQLLTKPERMDLATTIRTEGGRKSIMDIAEERHMQNVMMSIVAHEIADKKDSMPVFYGFIANVLQALKTYMETTKDPIDQREKSINRVIKILHTASKNYKDDDHAMAAHKKEISSIATDIQADHVKGFPNYVPNIFGHVHKSKLARCLQEALDKSPAIKASTPKYGKESDSD